MKTTMTTASRVALVALTLWGCGASHGRLPLSSAGPETPMANRSHDQHNQKIEEYDSFLGYCQSETISVEAQHTVSLLRQRLEDPSVDCESAYAELNEFVEIYLENVGIRDLSPIRGLARLKRLFLVSNPIRSTANLKNLPKLTDLDLDNVGLTKVPKLDQLPALRFLKLDGNPITSIEGLPDWITNLWINHTPVQDLSPLTAMKLTKLDASYLPKGVDWTPVGELTKLTSLRVNNNGLTNLDFAANLTRLTNLEANENEIVDISSLKNLNKLRNVELNSNKIVDASLLFDKINMTDLRLAFNDIRRIRIKQKNDQITDLTLNGNPIRNCEFVRFLPGLEKLYLEDMQLATINGLDDDLPKLNTVSIKNNMITTLTPLSSNKSDFLLLEYLDISGNRIKNFGPLMRIKGKKLHTFYGYDNPITKPYCPQEGVAEPVAHFCEMLPEGAGPYPSEPQPLF